MLQILINILLAFHIVVSVLIIFVVLMQRPKNEGLGAAFGGGMTENLFGAQTTNVLANFTRWLGGLFFALTLTLSVLYAKQTQQKSGIQKELLSAPPVIKKETPAPSPAAANPADPGSTVPVVVPPAATAPGEVEAPDAPSPAPAPAEAPAPDAAAESSAPDTSAAPGSDAPAPPAADAPPAPAAPPADATLP